MARRKFKSFYQFSYLALVTLRTNPARRKAPANCLSLGTSLIRTPWTLFASILISLSIVKWLAKLRHSILKGVAQQYNFTVSQIDVISMAEIYFFVIVVIERSPTVLYFILEVNCSSQGVRAGYIWERLGFIPTCSRCIHQSSLC